MLPTPAKLVLLVPTRPTELHRAVPHVSQATSALDKLAQHSQLLLTTTVGIYALREPIAQPEVLRRDSARQEPTILKKVSKVKKNVGCVKLALLQLSGAQWDVNHAVNSPIQLKDLLYANVRGSIGLTLPSMLLADARVDMTFSSTESARET